MAALRVGLDGRAFEAAASGVRRYVLELSRALVQLGEDLELVALGPRNPACVPGGVDAVAAPPGFASNVSWQVLALPWLARRARVDLLHAPGYTAPPAGVRPVVLTIHDVSYARCPGFYPYKRDRLRRLFYRMSAVRADAIITVSRFSRAEITAAYHVPAERIRVIHEAAAPVFGAAPASPPGATASAVAATAPYVLHVGDLHVRRDLMTALRAVIRVREADPACAGLRLVVIGEDREQVSPALDHWAAGAGHGSAVVRPKAVPDHELAEWYRGAAALVYPSRYEGFGLPLVEAMACGTPVVAADAGASPEVLEGAGMLFAPGDDRALADALRLVLSNRDAAARLRRTGLARASEFGWDRTARETLEVYRQCRQNPKSR